MYNLHDSFFSAIKNLSSVCFACIIPKLQRFAMAVRFLTNIPNQRGREISIELQLSGVSFPFMFL
jgi:hypothetical protein